MTYWEKKSSFSTIFFSHEYVFRLVTWENVCGLKIVPFFKIKKNVTNWLRMNQSFFYYFFFFTLNPKTFSWFNDFPRSAENDMIKVRKVKPSNMWQNYHTRKPFYFILWLSLHIITLTLKNKCSIVIDLFVIT